MKEQKFIRCLSGYSMLLLLIIVMALAIGGIIMYKTPLFLLAIPLIIFIIRGCFVVNPNDSKVLVLFGDYKGTVNDNGFFWTNPFYSREKISLRARNFDSERVKVNDKMGNPILINVILV